MLYTKHFYGFEKEGKCDTYNEKQVVSNVFNFRYPVNQYEIQDKLQPCIGLGLTDVEWLIPESEESKKQKQREAAALAERVAAMTPIEKRKYDREQKKKERIQEDLEPERQMAAGMEQLRKTLQTSQAPASEEAKTAVMFERLRGIVLNEADDTQDYELVVTADEVGFRGLKNQNNRMAPEDRNFLVYGRNLTEAGIEILKDLLKQCRTLVAPTKALKKREDVTEEEEAKLQEDFFNEFLPVGWYFDGSRYRTRDGYQSSRKHPNMEALIERHLDEINDAIGDHNRGLTKRIQEEQKQYE